ncbi:hypothetical protein EE612_057381, partial [Oryza sativa]
DKEPTMEDLPSNLGSAFYFCIIC